ncbi:hypothetical protein AHAS_Ahas06G0147000 [Arachis hypogaea]
MVVDIRDLIILRSTVIDDDIINLRVDEHILPLKEKDDQEEEWVDRDEEEKDEFDDHEVTLEEEDKSEEDNESE